jgi:hypothetical protein
MSTTKPSTHFQALDTRVSKTNQDDGSNDFVNGYEGKIIWCKELYYFLVFQTDVSTFLLEGEKHDVYTIT